MTASENVPAVTETASGTVGPFDTPESARQWLAGRAGLLAAHAGQNPAPDLRFRRHCSQPWIGPTCSDAVSYRAWSDTIELYDDGTSMREFDLPLIDGTLLHALGHRSRRAVLRGLYASGITLAMGGTLLAVVGASATTADHRLTVVAVLWATMSLLWGGLTVREHHRLEACADDYALTHGGYRPILAHLRRSSDPGRLQRIQRRIWSKSTLSGPEPAE